MSTKKKQPPMPAGKRAVSPTYDHEPVAQRVKPSALDLFAAQFDKPVPQAKAVRSSGSAGGPTATLSGVIIKSKQVTVTNQAGAPCNKQDVDVVITKVSANGAIDVVDTGVSGLSFLLPSQKPPKKGQGRDNNDTSPEGGRGGGGGGDDSASGKGFTRRKVLYSDEVKKTVWLGMLRTGTFTEKKGGEKKSGADALVVGMPVEITGVTANFSKDDTSAGLYINCAEIKPELSHMPAGAVASTIMNQFMKPEAMAGAALLHSQSMFGFFDGSVLTTEAQMAQANVFKELWLKGVAGAANSCDAKATAIAAEAGPRDSAALAVQERAKVLRATGAADVASGANILFIPSRVPGENDPPSMMHAPLLQFGKTPKNPMPKMLVDVFTPPEDASKIPNTFVALDITQVENPEGTFLFHCFARLHFVGDYKMAVKQVNEGEQPIISSQGPCVGFKVGMREFGPATLGTTNKPKAFTWMQEMMKTAWVTAVVGVHPKAPEDTTVVDFFTPALHVDMCATLLNCATRLSEEFVIEHLAGGGSNPRFDFEQDDVTAEQITPKDDEHPLPDHRPTLAKMAYVALSEGAFNFNKARMPADKQNKVYCAVYPRCADAAKQFDLTDTDQGEAAVSAAAEAAGIDVGRYLADVALVYCIAVE